MHRVKVFSGLLIFFLLNFYVNAQQTLFFTDDDGPLLQAISLYNSGKYNAGRSMLENYLETSPEDNNLMEARYYLAMCAIKLYHDDGEYLLRQFTNRYPGHPLANQAFVELGDFYYRSGKYGKAVTYYKRVNANKLSRATAVETRFRMAYSYFNEQKFNDALVHFDYLKNSSNPYTHAAHYYSGYIYYRNKDYDKAVTEFKQAESGASYKEIVPSLIALSYYETQQYEELIQYGEQVNLSGRKIRNSSDFYLSLAEAYFFSNQKEKALVYYDKFISTNKGKVDERIALRIGIANYEAGNFETAVNRLRPLALTEGEIGQRASFFLGLCYLESGNKNYAPAPLKKAYEMNNDAEISKEALLLYAKLNLELGNFDDAITGLEAFKEQYPNEATKNNVNDWLSQAYLYNNNYQAAYNHLSNTNLNSPQLREVFQRVTYNLAVESFNRKEVDKALGFANESIRVGADRMLTSKASYLKGEIMVLKENYPEAVNAYSTVFRNEDESSELFLDSRYGIGYAYFNDKKYDKAITHFKVYSSLNGETEAQKRKIADATLRLGDSYYVTKQYSNAISAYNSYLNKSTLNVDYAAFQLAASQWLEGKDNDAVQSLSKLVRSYPNSVYREDAAFQIGTILFEGGKYQESIDAFTRFLSGATKQDLIVQAHVKRALAATNLQDYDMAIKDYKMAVSKYPTYPSAYNALLGLQDLLARTDQSEQFDQYLKIYRETNPENKQLLTVRFESAKSLLYAGKYPEAIGAFDDIIKDYQGTTEAYEAQYLKAEALRYQGKPTEAILAYQKVIEQNKTNKVNRARQKIGDLQQENGNWESSIAAYSKLENDAVNNREKYDAVEGLMIAYYNTNQYDKTIEYADKALQIGSPKPSSVTMANVYKGKALLGKGETEAAVKVFDNLVANASDEYAAEAMFRKAEVLYKSKNYKASNEILYEFINKFGAYDYWLGRSFILISDNFIGLDELIQAEATLNSVIENAENEENVEMANAKLAELKGLGKQIVEENYIDTDSIK
ncbi:tetratricopeptide repeat protein [Marinigracilibium pacificum]|uniref:Tetratricopeptide repeat protein n=1 Tax=Marinigracilibium pacificum TaxID=2729599 RepID=A0A848J273_9BACT|nr:tetratricopeptide repeat protein [Marinigracilibium pacificum]NMM48409.1 tetratricopeptide repeat protein [Marinigracilibium pacificum]